MCVHGCHIQEYGLHFTTCQREDAYPFPLLKGSWATGRRFSQETAWGAGDRAQPQPYPRPPTLGISGGPLGKDEAPCQAQASMPLPSAGSARSPGTRQSHAEDKRPSSGSEEQQAELSEGLLCTVLRASKPPYPALSHTRGQITMIPGAQCKGGRGD